MLAEPFYDEVHRWTFHSKNSLSRVAGPIDSDLLHYRRLIRGAQRFVVDDDLLEHTVYLSNTPDQDQFSYWSVLARLPYDTMWVEWDQHARLRLSNQLGKLEHAFNPEEVSQPNGMLLVRDLASPSKWVMYMFARESTGEVFVNPLVSVYDPDGSTVITPQGLQQYSEAAPDHIHTVAALGQPSLVDILNYPAGSEYAILGYRASGKTSYAAPIWSINKVGLLEEPIWRKFRLERLRRGASLKDVQEPYTEQLYENRGILRGMLVLLSILNNVPKVLRDSPIRKGYRSAGANKVKFLDHHTIHLKLPKTRRLEYIQQRLRLGYGRYRRHDVRGFYRRTTNDRLGIRCHHVPTADSTSDHITCGRCGSSIRWVNEFQRGDEKLGFVQKTYKLGLGVLS